MRRTHRLIVLTLTTLLLGVVASSAALAGGIDYPPDRSIACSASVAAPGQSVTCSAKGFLPGSSIDVIVSGRATDGGTWTLTLQVTADETGEATATFVVPTNAAEGPATVTFTGPDAMTEMPRSAVATFTVQVADDGGAGEPGGSGALPGTGGNFTIGMALAALALLIGGALLIIGRRRSREEVSDR